LSYFSASSFAGCATKSSPHPTKHQLRVGGSTT